MYQHPARLNKKERTEGRKLIEEARTKEIYDEVVQGERPTMGQKNCKIQTSKGRGVRQERSSNQKNTVNTNYTHKQLKCFYTNADSLINKFTEFKARVESHGCMGIAITEVKPKNQKFLLNTAELGLSDYDLYHNIDKQGRGICINTHKTLKAKPFVSLGTNFQESIWVEIKLNKKDSFLIGCVYKSPGSSGSNNEQLNEMISEVMRYRHLHMLLLEDFTYPNIDWQNWYTLSENTNSPDTKFKEGIRDNFLFQHVTLPTRGRLGNKSNILDLVFTNEKYMIDDIVYESPLGKSDHSVLIIIFRCYAEIASHTQILLRPRGL